MIWGPREIVVRALFFVEQFAKTSIFSTGWESWSFAAVKPTLNSELFTLTHMWWVMQLTVQSEAQLYTFAVINIFNTRIILWYLLFES